VRVGRLSWSYLAFAAYAAASLLMLNDPRQPLLPPPLSGRVQLSDAVFVVAIAVWLAAGAPGVARVARVTGIPAGVWIAANVVTAAFAVLPGPAWRETAVFAYLGLVLVWGAALLAEPVRLQAFTRWWLGLVAAVVVVGLIGGLAATLSGEGNYLVYQGRDMYLFGDRVFRVRSTLTPTTKLLATLLILALPVAFVLRRHGTPRERRLVGWLVVLMTLCELLTYSRQILEYLGLLGLLLWLEGRRRRVALITALAIAFVVGNLGVMVLSTWRITDAEYVRTADHARTLTDDHYYSTIPAMGVQTAALRVEYVHDNYFIMKWISWKGFLERPLTGWGPDAWPRVREWARKAGHAPATRFGFESAQSEPFTIAAEMGLVGLAAWAAFWMLSLCSMWASTAQGFAGILARYQALGCGATLLTSIHLDVMRFRFLWIALALGMAAAVCVREEVPT
jgi:hypothetical protein